MTPYYQDDAVTIYHGDSREIAPELPRPCSHYPGQTSCDWCRMAVLTDPPYGIGDRWAKSEMVGRNGSSRLWGKGDTWDDEAADLAHLPAVPSIIWGGNYFGLPPARGWLVWDKVQAFTGADAELAWTNLDMPVRVFRLSRIDAHVNQSESRKEHPTEKPVSLMRWCLGFLPADAVILDPFMGSGTTLRAAKDLGRKAIGIEIEERYCEIAARRCSQEVLGLLA